MLNVRCSFHSRSIRLKLLLKRQLNENKWPGAAMRNEILIPLNQRAFFFDHSVRLWCCFPFSNVMCTKFIESHAFASDTKDRTKWQQIQQIKSKEIISKAPTQPSPWISIEKKDIPWSFVIIILYMSPNRYCYTLCHSILYKLLTNFGKPCDGFNA